MKIYLVLDKDGMRRIAEGQEPFHWDFQCRSAGPKLPEEGVLMAEIDVTLPTQESMIPPMMAILDRQVKLIHAAKADELREVEAVRQKLLQLPPPSAKVVEVPATAGADDDFPF